MNDDLMDEIANCNSKNVSMTTDELSDMLSQMSFDIDYKKECTSENSLIISSQTIQKVKQPQQQQQIAVFKEEPFCCLCGLRKSKHSYARHRFFEAKPEHKCIECNKWFYQHDHEKSPCFDPYVRL